MSAMVSTELAPSADVRDVETQSEYQRFLHRVEREFLEHPTVRQNPYLLWFREGNADLEDMRELAVQFSVFANQFLVALMMKIANSDSLESMRATKEIFLNELGVLFKSSRAEDRCPVGELAAHDKEIDLNPKLINIKGTVDGGTFRFQAAHYEWFLKFAASLGLEFHEIGRRSLGTEPTLRFSDKLQEYYAHEDPDFSSGASFALESWSASGFWQDLVDGMTRVKQRNVPQLSFAFFTWHNRIEGQHAMYVHSELEAIYAQPGFDPEKFIQGGREMLDAVYVIWEDLLARVKQRRPEVA